ncbi:MAG: hypothetical protein WB491_03030 [Candidatus Aquilonibacter sp.]
MPRTYRLGQRKASADETRARIIAGARELLLSDDGYRRFTMDAIARHTNVARTTVAGATTILSGIAALWIVSGGFNPAFMRSTTGILISCGAACGVLAVATGITTGRLQEKGAPFAVATGTLLVIALVCMTLGAHA